MVEAEQEQTSAPTDLTEFKLTSVVLSPSSPLLGQTLATANVRRNYQTHVVALERHDAFVEQPADLTLRVGARLWIVGTSRTAEQLK